MHIIVVGCGRVGARLASLLSHEGHSIVVIDRDPEALGRLEITFRGAKIIGVGFDREVLLEAGIDRADALAAVTGSDNTNFVAASVGVDDFQVPRVVARIADPLRAEIYGRLGIPTISSTLWASARIRDLIVSKELHNVLSLGSGGVELYEFEIPSRLVARTPADMSVLGEVAVVAIIRQGRSFLPYTATPFEAHDRIVAAADSHAISKLQAMLGFLS